MKLKIYLQSDAIVNSANETLTLNTGVVSKSILLAAGQNIQNECTEIMQQRLQKQLDSKEVVVSNGHKLQCRYVFHGALESWANQVHLVDITDYAVLSLIFTQRND